MSNKQNRQLSDAAKAILGAEAVAELGTEEITGETTTETSLEENNETTGVSEGQEQEVQEASTATEPEVTQTPATELQGTEEPAPDAAEAAQKLAEAPVVQEPPVVNAAPAVIAEPKPTTPVQQTAKAPSVASDNLGTIGRRVMSILSAYAEQMAPRKPVTDAKIVEQQRLLYEALTKTINDSGDDFDVLMKQVLAFFEQHKAGVFHETRIFRGMDNLPLSTNDRAAFQRLLNLFKLVANPQSRGLALKQVDLVASLQYGVTENGRNRVMNFFHK